MSVSTATRPSGPMRVMAIVALGSTIALCAYRAAVSRWGAAGYAAGRLLFAHRDELDQLLENAPSDGRVVAWLGDSTIAGTRRTYPHVLAGRLNQKVRPLVVASAGWGPGVYYAVLDRVLEKRPTLIVLVAHLRIMNPRDWNDEFFVDLLSEVSARDLPAAAMLPWAAYGVTIPRLLLYQALAIPSVADGVSMGAGLRLHFRRVVLRRAGPRVEYLRHRGFRTDEEVRRYQLAAYDFPMSRRTPAVQMLAGAVARATRAGIPVFVVGAPIPWEALEGIGRWDPDAAQQRTRVVSDAVSEAGGRFLDLHRALRQHHFSDTGGHYTRAGVDRMVTLLEPHLRAALW